MDELERKKCTTNDAGAASPPGNEDLDPVKADKPVLTVHMCAIGEKELNPVE
jgi:hypothetical protein